MNESVKQLEEIDSLLDELYKLEIKLELQLAFVKTKIDKTKYKKQSLLNYLNENE